MSSTLKIAIAGSTVHTKNSARILTNHPEFEISWVLTPEPKKVGRQQKLTFNPLHEWAHSQQVPCFLVKDKIDHQLQEEITNQPDYLPDYLLVIDFGYFIPNWLLNLPKKAPLNLHPSALPSWRGSSPGQFILLNGTKKSAVSLIQLTDKLDSGPIIQQAEFEIGHSWNADDYYQHSFSIANEFLTNWILAFDHKKLTAKPQPTRSPTVEARKINKNDARVDWKILQFLMKNEEKQKNSQQKAEQVQASLETKTILDQQLKKEVVSNWPDVIERASRAFQPWPILWTEVPTVRGKKRMQILSCAENENKRLELKKVKIEGQTIKSWQEVKNQVKNPKKD